MSNLLYVEDHPSQRDLVAQLLTREGFEVALAADGVEGVEQARVGLPDLILMDLRMPRMDGAEAIRTLRQNPATVDIPIFAISAWPGGQIREQAFAAGADEFFAKPVDFGQLIVKIKLYLEHPPLRDTASVFRTPSGAASPSGSSRYTFNAREMPYIAGPPVTRPDMFYGRQADLDKVIGLLTGNFVMLNGRRRIGKTSLLYQLLYHLPRLKPAEEQLIPVLISVEGLSESEFYHAVMEEIINAAQKHLPPGAMAALTFDLTSPTYSARSFARDVQIILKGLAALTPKSARLVLLMDEMDTFNRFSLITQAHLRRIFQRFANHNLSVVVAGVKLQERWAGESSPFYNMFVPVTLSPFPEAEARRLISEPVKDTYRYSEPAITRILEVTLGLPHRIQQLCLETIHRLQTTAAGRNDITEHDVRSVIKTTHWADEEEKLSEITADDFNRLKEETGISSRLKAILNSMADGIIVLDRTGDPLFMNPIAQTITETLTSDLPGTHASRPDGEAKLSQPRSLSVKLLDTLTKLELYQKRRIQVGNKVLDVLSTPVVTSSGEQIGSVVALRDITQEVATEKIRDDFITSVSHELRTPLTAIKGYNDLLKMTVAGKLNENQIRFFDSIDDNVRDLLNIIQQMLDLSQIDADELGIDQEPLDLTELIEAEAAKWVSKMAEKEISLDTNLPDGPVWVEGDWSRLSQVIDNLLDNAYNYSLQGANVEILLNQDNSRGQIDVKDSGVGILEKDQPYIFTRFFRAIHDERTYDVSGAGLALYICKAIIEAHDGEIWFKSKPYQGSTFSFAFPTVDNPDKPADIEQDSIEFVQTESRSGTFR